MYKYINNIKNQQSGISLILSMIILVAIFGLVIIVTNVAFDIRASNKAIGLSEKALFASESAIEWTIYEIEKDPANALNAFVPNPTFDESINLPDGEVAYWDRNVAVSVNTPGLCGADIPKPVCTLLNEPVGNTNDLEIRLENGQSFQLDLDIVGAAYPTHVSIDTSGKASDVIIVDYGGQEIIPPGTVQIPQTGQISSTPGLKFKLINGSGGPQQYTLITQGGSNELPLGIDIDVTGKYKGTERNIRLTRPAWLIY